MSAYFVAGGTYTKLNGKECFELVCPGPGEPPYVMIDGVMNYFRLIWQNAHLYRVEDDWSLSLIAPSPEALQLGIQAPERVWLDEEMVKRLRAAIRPNNSPATPEENRPSGCLELNNNGDLTP